MTLALIIVFALAALALAARTLRDRSLPLAVRLDAVLPQTQCRQCGYQGCRPYAEAIAAGAAINRCPPGGDPVIRKLAALTRRPALPLDAARGEHLAPRVARIDETRCIGCTLCIRACPVDAIVGAPKVMHTVILEQCTGCELCLPPCPVDCIALEPRPWRAGDLLPGSGRAQAAAARQRFERRSMRLERERRSHERRAAESARAAPTTPQAPDDAQARKRAIVEAALARARSRLAASR